MTSNNESLIPALRSGAGCVLFLPGLNYKNSDKLLCENRNCRRGCHLEKEGYNHPIVVLAITTKGAAGIASSKSDIQFVQLTSKVSTKNEYMNTSFTPIIARFPSGNLRQTHYQLEDPLAEFSVPSYIRLMHVYTLPIKRFEVYFYQKQPVVPFRHRLDSKSYSHLIQRIKVDMRGLREDTFVPTTELRKLAQVSSPPSWGHRVPNGATNLHLRGGSLSQTAETPFHLPIRSSPTSSPPTLSGQSEHGALTLSLSDSESIHESQMNSDADRVSSERPPSLVPVIESPPRPRPSNSEPPMR